MIDKSVPASLVIELASLPHMLNFLKATGRETSERGSLIRGLFYEGHGDTQLEFRRCFDFDIEPLRWVALSYMIPKYRHLKPFFNVQYYANTVDEDGKKLKLTGLQELLNLPDKPKDMVFEVEPDYAYGISILSKKVDPNSENWLALAKYIGRVDAVIAIYLAQQQLTVSP